MAFFDWDGDGKKTWADDFIEFHIFQEMMKEEEEPDEPDYMDDADDYCDSSGCGLDRAYGSGPDTGNTTLPSVDAHQTDSSPQQVSNEGCLTILILNLILLVGLILTFCAGGGVPSLLVLVVTFVLVFAWIRVSNGGT